MTTVAQLTIEMAANVARLKTDMDASRLTVKRAFDGIERDVGRLKNVLGGVFAGFGATQVVQMADSITQLRNQLGLASRSTQEAESAFGALFKIAQESRVNFTSLGGTYAAIARATSGLNMTQQQLLVITQAIGNAMTISGGSAESMNAALLQLRQGLASGTLRGEELNSVMEQTPRLAQALADGLGVGIGRLREMGAAGELTSQRVLIALTSQSEKLQSEVARSTLTVNSAFTNLSSATAKFIGDADKATGATTSLAGAMNEVAKAIGAMGGAIGTHKQELTVIFGALAGVGLVAALPKIFTGILSLAGAVKVLGVALASNPITLTLLGIGAVAGAVYAGTSAFDKTAAGIRRTITELERLNQQAAAEPWDAVLNANVAKRTQQILELRKQLKEVEGPPVGSVGSGDTMLARAMQQQAAAVGMSEADRKKQAAAASKAAAAAKREEADALRKVIELAEHRNRLFDEEFQKEEAARLVVEGRIRSAREMLEAIEQETRLMGLSGLEREKAVALLELERKGVEKGTEAYERLAPAILAAIEARSARAAGLMTVDEIIEEAARTAKTVGNNTSNTLADSISQGILEGARNGSNIMQIFKRELEAQFARTILRPMVQPVAEGINSLISTGLNALLGAFGGGSTSSGYNPGAGMGFSTNWEQYLPSFAGGGHTGNGARSGGLDGQGGFMAMLHPRERVVDEAAGGGNVILNVITPPGQAMTATQSSRTGEDGTRIVDLILTAVGDGLANRSGPVARGLENGYGLRPSMG
jgi:tape measure domain-containing protein